MEEKYCKFCGEKIPMDAVICTHCGRQVEELKGNKPDNIVINNSAASSASSVNQGPIRRKHSILFDLFMIFITCGLWIIWMIIRPKYY